MDRRSHGGGHEDGADEKPSRTLFIRNVAYEAKEDELLAIFGKYGEIKRIFNLVDQRGMLFVTYYDSRHADAAKAELQDSLIRDRKIDIHYSLPKEEDLNSKRSANDVENNKGVLFVTATGADPQNPPTIDTQEIQDLFQSWCTFAEVKQVRDCRAPNQKFVELFDLRDSEAIFNEKQNHAFAEGIQLSIQFAKQGNREQREGGLFNQVDCPDLVDGPSFRRNFSHSQYGGNSGPSGGGSHNNNNGRSGFSGGRGGGGYGSGGQRNEGGRGGAMRPNFNSIRTTREAPFNSHQGNNNYGGNYNNSGRGGGNGYNNGSGGGGYNNAGGGNYNGSGGARPDMSGGSYPSSQGGGANMNPQNALSNLGNLAGNLNAAGGGGQNLLAQLAATIVASAGQNNNNQQAGQGGGADVAQQLVNYLAMQRKLNDLGNNQSNNAGGGYTNSPTGGNYSSNSGGYNNGSSGGYNNSSGGSYTNSGSYNNGYNNNSGGGYNNSNHGGYNDNSGGYNNSSGYSNSSYNSGSYGGY